MKETKFKQTEVGMIPCDWEVCPLNFFADILNGDRGVNYPKDSDFCDAGIPFINAGHLKKCQIDFSCMDYITYEHYKKLGGAKIKKNDILFCLRGSLGKYAYVNFDDAAPASSLCVLRSKKIDPKYLFQLLGFEYIKTQIIDANSGSSQPNLSAKDVGNFNVIFPPTIEEQQRIANVLSDVDTLIANLEKLIAKKKNIKQGAMQQLLTGRKRLPGFGSDERQKECHSKRSAKREESSGYKMTELGLIPIDWEFVPVSELAKDMADGPFGSNLKKEHYTSDPQTRIIQLSNIGENGWEDENTKYTTFEHAKTIARCIVPKEESILVAKMMPAGRAIICPKKEKQYVLGSDVIRITANEKLNSKYFVYASKSDAYLKQISDNTQGSTRQRTSISKLRKILILLPSLAEQTAIANVLSDMDAEISALETKLAKYRTLKTGMMQQLLTGKIRLV